MFKQLKMKKKINQLVTEIQPIADVTRIGKTCPKCYYTRKENEQAPEWQCPSCQIAYNKFNAINNKIKKSISATVNNISSTSIKQKLKSLELKAAILFLPGFFTFLAGMSSAMCGCKGVAKTGNPFLLVIGGVVIVLSAFYYIKNRIRIKNENSNYTN
jgi:ribosomal protein L37AE/L43A